MEILVVGLVSLLLAAVALAFCIDWLGLWMSQEETRREFARGSEGAQWR